MGPGEAGSGQGWGTRGRLQHWLPGLNPIKPPCPSPAEAPVAHTLPLTSLWLLSPHLPGGTWWVWLSQQRS